MITRREFCGSMAAIAASLSVPTSKKPLYFGVTESYVVLSGEDSDVSRVINACESDSAVAYLLCHFNRVEGFVLISDNVWCHWNVFTLCRTLSEASAVRVMDTQETINQIGSENLHRIMEKIRSVS